MNIFLSVLSSNKKNLGTLQMVYAVWKGGQVSQNWEWVGGNKTNDGGTWKWLKTDVQNIYIELNSNIYKRIVARMYAERWNDGAFPPLTPWFVAPSPYEWDNVLNYYGVNGNQNISAIWLPK